MKTIGLIGGMSWESSAEYYRIINEAVKARLGGLHSADCLMYSFDFDEIEQYQMQGRWDIAEKRLIEVAQRLEQAGADCVLICTNTMHKMAEAVQDAITIPLLHIADTTADAIKGQGLNSVGLLGTVFTMEEAFYKGRLVGKFGLQVLIPDIEGRALVNRVIYEELVKGIIDPKSREEYVKIIHKMAKNGTQGVILGCTEIGLLIHPEDSPIPVFDTTTIHAMAAVDFALA
jgi:aspartate racemase